MTRRPSTTRDLEPAVNFTRTVRTLGALALAATTVLAGVAVGSPSAAVAAECTTPRADSPSGATFTVTSGAVAPGGTITVSGTGFERTQTDGLGQTLSFKLNDQVQWSQTLKADDDGTVSGTLSLADLPADDVAAVVDAACGKAWVRVLVGSAAAGDMAPNRSVHASFELAAAAPTATATPAAGTTTAAATTTGTTTGTAAGTTAAATTGGQLPQTGIEDTPAIVWVVALLAVSAAAAVADRALRRRGARARV